MQRTFAKHSTRDTALRLGGSTRPRRSPKRPSSSRGQTLVRDGGGEDVHRMGSYLLLLPVLGGSALPPPSLSIPCTSTLYIQTPVRRPPSCRMGVGMTAIRWDTCCRKLILLMSFVKRDLKGGANPYPYPQHLWRTNWWVTRCNVIFKF